MAASKNQGTLKFKGIPLKKEQGISQKHKEVQKSVKQTSVVVKTIELKNSPPTSVDFPKGEDKTAIQEESPKRKEGILFTNEAISTPLPSLKEIKTHAKRIWEKILQGRKQLGTVDFPKNFRFITETNVLLGILSVVFLFGSLFLIVTVQGKLAQKQALERKRTAMQAQITHWQEVVKKYPGYRDAYFQLALLEYQLGDFQASQEYVTTVESLDPTFERAYQLEKMIEK